MTTWIAAAVAVAVAPALASALALVAGALGRRLDEQARLLNLTARDALSAHRRIEDIHDRLDALERRAGADDATPNRRTTR